MSMSLVFSQILVILLYVAAGFLAGKTGVIGKPQRKDLTNLCSRFILPFTILSASSQQVSGEEMRSLLMASLLFLAVFLGTTLVCLLIFRLHPVAPAFRTVFTSLVSYPNCSFLGLPLCSALFGAMGVLYSAGAVLMFNLLFFTVQWVLFTGKKFVIRTFLTPTMLSTAVLFVMLLTGLHFPGPLQTVVGNIGAMITPLSLMIIGVMMSENRLLAIFSESAAYLVVLIRNLLIPLLCIGLLRLLPMESTARLCVLVYLACPSAALTSLFAIDNDVAPELGAHGVLMSTIAFAATLPLILYIGQKIL